MFRATAAAAMPRLAACAVCVSAVMVQRQRQLNRTNEPAACSAAPLVEQQQHHRQPVATRAAAAALAPSVWPTMRLAQFTEGSAVSPTLVRALFVRLARMWPALSLGAAACWAAISATVVSTLTQLKAAAQAPAGSHAQVLDVSTVKQFCGHWSKVAAQSDSTDSFCQLFGVPRWLRHASRLITGMHIYLQDDNTLVIKQVCKVGWLSPVETFPLDGSCSKPHKRRDLRPGKQVGQLLEAHDGSMVVTVSGPAYTAIDKLVLQEAPQGGGVVLLVQHKAHVKDKGSAEFKEVFRLSA